MNIKKFKNKTTLWAIIVTIVFIASEVVILTNTKKGILIHAKETLKEAVDIDLMTRSEKAGIHKQVFLETHTGKAVKYPLEIHGVSKDGKVIALTIRQEKDSLNINPIRTEGKNRFLKSYLHKTSYATQADTLQAIWETLLREKKITLPVSLRIDYNWESEYYTQTTADTLSQSHSHALPYYYIGSLFEYTLHGYSQTSMLRLFFHSLNGANLYAVIGYLCILALWLFIRKLKKRKNPFENRQNDPNLYYFNDFIAYNKKTRELYVKKTKKKLRNQVALLFTLFIESEEHTPTQDQIHQTIWPEGNWTDNGRRTLLQNLRSALPAEYFKIENQYRGDQHLLFTDTKENEFLAETKDQLGQIEEKFKKIKRNLTKSHKKH